MISFLVKVFGGVGVCRGTQVAEYIGARLNPTEGYENDMCIFVKNRPPAVFPDRSFYDVNDHPRACTWLLDHPEMKVITVSQVQTDEYMKILENDLVFIPHHHCNYERAKRPDREIRTVGVMGNVHSFYKYTSKIKRMFEDKGFEFIYIPSHTTREDCCEFYKAIDIQVVWRPHQKARLRDPLKLSNAGSFGIPSVCYPEEAYVREWGDKFIHVRSIEEMIDATCKLRDEPSWYEEMANRAILKAERYHMEHISKLYLQLEGLCS